MDAGIGEKPGVPDSEHPLEFPYTLWFTMKSKDNKQNYEESIQPVGTFSSVEQFWNYYTHLKQPTEFGANIDYHVFKWGIKPIWEDEANRLGGKWIIRLHKGVTNRVWENLLLAMLGEQFMVGEEVCGAVVSIRTHEDIISLWNRTASEQVLVNRIRDTLRRVLNLPAQTVLEYKAHESSLKDKTSFKNTNVYIR